MNDGASSCVSDGEEYEGFDGKIWQVHKFGGTSVANAECFVKVARIVEEQIGIVEGSSVGDDDGYSNRQVAVVVSAMGGKPKVTDLLLSSVSAAAKREEEGVKSALNSVLAKHDACIDALFPPTDPSRKDANDNPIALKVKAVVKQDVADIEDILKTVALMKWEATRISELVSGYGETWSTLILSELLSARCRQREGRIEDDECGQQHRFSYLDARLVITIDEETIKDGSVCWSISSQKLKQEYQKLTSSSGQDRTNRQVIQHLVMTGYICSNTQGVSSTLQRDGSDYSAAILGRLLQSSSISIWTDVSGVLSADPRRVPDSYVLPEVSYNEAMELAYFGAKVIHPKTMRPALMKEPRQIPIFIRNTFDPQHSGSRIFTSSTTHAERDRCVCGFSTVEKIAIVNVEGSGMVGVRGVARRLFQRLEGIGVNVTLISQASSEHSITFAMGMRHATEAKNAIEEEFHREIQENLISEIEIVSPCSIIAAVGDGMHLTTGVAGRFFSALGDAKINVLAISQGSNERNISAVILEEESTKALRVVHAAFRLSHSVVRVGILGMNDIGESLLRLLETQRSKLLAAFDIDLQVCAVLKDSSSDDIVVLKKKEGITADANADLDGNKDTSVTMDAYNAAMNSRSAETPSTSTNTNTNTSMGTNTNTTTTTAPVELSPGGLHAYINTIASQDQPHAVIFDCTADETISKHHIDWLRAGVNIVTANNTALSGPQAIRDTIRKIERAKKARYLREVTVGGGLPIVSTLNNLLTSGDRIHRIDGILSVTMSYIMHRIAPPQGLGDCNEFDSAIGLGPYRGKGASTDHHHYPVPNTTDGNNVTDPCSFSDAVKEAIALGLTEEDPIKDFSNEYTARCLMVLATELGLDDGLDIERILRAGGSIISDMPNTPKHYDTTMEAQLDAKMKKRVHDASKKGCVPRHVSSVDVKTGLISISIVDVPRNHIFATTPPSCECVRFFTERHKRYPLIVQGPSAGADSTASALLAELLNLMRTKVGTRSGVLSRTSTSLYLA